MFNWFGIGMITLFLNIIFLPYSIIYWLVKLIYFLITVGREKDWMLSRNANYDMDTALNEINEKKLLLDVKVET